MSRISILRLGVCLGLLVVSGAPARAQFYEGFSHNFIWADPPPERGIEPLAPREVREILRREGVKMLGAPRLRGAEIIAFGRDFSGAERRFTLDAETGEVLQVKLTREPPERRRAPVQSVEPSRPLGAPVHPGGALDADHLGAPPPPAPPEQVVPPPPKKAEAAPPPPAEELAPPDPRGPDPDAALSPIKPQRTPGAPKVEKLPQ